jgi:hypothetical protein
MLEDMAKGRRQHGSGYEYTGGTQLWMITPLVGGFAKGFVKWVSIDVPKDDVVKIVSATITVDAESTKDSRMVSIRSNSTLSGRR